VERGRNLYVTLITSAHPRSLTLFVHKSNFSMHSPASCWCTTTLPSHQDPRARGDKIHIHVEWLQNIDTITTSLAPWGWSSWHLLGFAWYVYLFFPFPDDSTDESVGFVAYPMSNQPWYITRRVDTRTQKRWILLVSDVSGWSLLPIRLCTIRTPRVRKLTFIDVPFSYLFTEQLILTPSPTERSPY